MLPSLLLFSGVQSCVGDIQKKATESRRVRGQLLESGISCTEIERHLEAPESSWSYLCESVGVPRYLALICKSSIKYQHEIWIYFAKTSGYLIKMIVFCSMSLWSLSISRIWGLVWVGGWLGAHEGWSPGGYCLLKGELTDKSKHYARFCSAQTTAPFRQ